MTQTRTLFRSFAGGEISPEMAGRIDLAKYRTGLALCRNFIPLPHGPIVNRAGTKFIRAVKNSSLATRLIPFVYSTTQTYALEFGNGYVRFHTQSGTLLDGSGDPVEIATPYAYYELAQLKYTQSADVMTITHPAHAPWQLKRVSSGGWYGWDSGYESYGSSLAAPTGVTCEAVINADYGSPPTYPVMQNHRYVVTAVSNDGVSESAASAEVTSMGGTQTPSRPDHEGNKLSDYGNWNTVDWSAVSGAARYNVYKNTENTGIYGYIGQTKGPSFRDNNITPDFSRTPPEQQAPFVGFGSYPAAVTYHEQRKVFGGGINGPQTLWFTRSGTEADFRRSLPTRDDDAITARIVSREVMAIRHIVPLSDLVLLTSGGEWKVSASGGEALTPASISVRQQSYTGASDVIPVLVGNACIYVQSKGSHLRELSYQWQTQAFQSVDLSLFAPHLFYGRTITQLAYTAAPYPIIWAVRDDGVLLSCTYVQEQEVVAWAQHATDGVFESVCAISEGNEDALYCIVRRTISGTDKRYVERMAGRIQVDNSAANTTFMDSALHYSGGAATVISGLDHLEGKTVGVYANGHSFVGTFAVSSGAVTLPYSVTGAVIGLLYTATAKTLPVVVDGQEGGGNAGLMVPKNVSWVAFAFDKSYPFRAGTPGGTQAVAVSGGTLLNGLYTGQTGKVILNGAWDGAGAVEISQPDPIPLCVASLTMEVSVGS
jgi:hypothetical protein